MKKNKWMWILCVAILTLGLAAPAAAWGQARDPRLNDSQEPGSVLVFHKFLRGTVLTTDQMTLPRTQFEISVTCPKGATCLESGQGVRLKMHWVCGGFGTICQETDFSRFTTVHGTLWFNPENVGPRTTNVPAPPCQGGYLIVWVENVFGQPIKFDGLIGNAIIREGALSAGAYNALPIQASTNLGTFAPTDVSPLDGNLDFNGGEYQALTGKLFGTVRYNLPNTTGTVTQIETFLTLLTLDVRSNRFNNPTSVDFRFFDSFELLISGSTSFGCWAEFSLNELPFLEGFSPGGKGLVEAGPAEKEPVLGFDDASGPVTLLGIIETKERDPVTGAILREYSYSMYNDSTPVVTTFEPNP